MCAGQDAIDVADLDDSFDSRGRTKLQDDRAPILARICSQAGYRVDDRCVDERRITEVEDELFVGQEPPTFLEDLRRVRQVELALETQDSDLVRLGEHLKLA